MPVTSAKEPRQSSQHLLDETLFDRWVDEYARELYRFAYRLCGDRPAAEDLVQETFYEVWKHRSPLRCVRKPRAWLFLILRRRYLKLRRMEQRRPWLMPLDSARETAAAKDGGIDRIETTDSLQSALNSMSDMFKLPLLMVFVQRMSCAQAAEQLDLPLGTVLSRIHRAKKQMRDAIREQEERRLSKPCGAADMESLGDTPRLRIGSA